MTPRRWLVGLAVIAGTVVLLFADRSPAAAKAILQTGRSVNRKFESAAGVNWISREDIPFHGDTIGHFFLWAALTLLVLIVLRNSLPTWAVVLGSALLAVVVEISQSVFTTTREASVSDLAANGLGIVLAILLNLLIKKVRTQGVNQLA